MDKTIGLSELGRTLASKDSAVAVKKLNEAIDQAKFATDRKMRSGLSKADYATAQLHIRALDSAKLIIKSVHLYHQS